MRVSDPKKHRGTAIDLLCRTKDKDKAYIVIEVKTRVVSMDRHQSTYTQVDSHKPVTALKTPNSLYWRHMSQLRQTVEMFKLSRRGRNNIVRGYVLVTLQGSCLPYPLQ